MSDLKNLIGQTFGELTVIKRVENNKYGRARWLCKCSCGNEKITTGKLLLKGDTKSCGCIKRNLNQYEFDKNICIATTSKGVKHIFDIEDYEKVKDISWQMTEFGYIYGIYNKKQVFIHQLITGFKYPIIDHINRNKLDNRKCNLRPATTNQNARNKCVRRTNNSGYIGVSWDKRENKWLVKICVDYKSIFLGRYKNIEDAIKARLKAEKEYYGEFAPQRDLFEKYGI